MPLLKRPTSLTSSVPWNLGMITLGAAIYAVAIRSVVVPHGFVSGGFYGLGLLFYYGTGWLSPGTWFFVLNLPVFALGWLVVGHRFLLYSLYSMCCMSLFTDWMPALFQASDSMLASVIGGAIVGAALGTIMRSLGSVGGLSIISVILNQRWGIRIGQVSFWFNLALYLVGLTFLESDRLLYSMVLAFVSSQVTDYFLGLFNERKMAIIVSDKGREVADAIMKDLGRGVTFLQGWGAYSGSEHPVLISVVHNHQIRRLENLVFGLDKDAFLVVENTFSVLGHGFSSPKKY